MPKVVLADDEEYVRYFLKSLLNTIDYDVVGEAENAFELNDVLKKQNTDILFLDINMPEKSGLEFLKERSKMFPKTCIVLLTNNALSSLINEQSLFNVRCFIRKSTPIEEMKNMIVKTWEDFQEAESEIEFFETKTLKI